MVTNIVKEPELYDLLYEDVNADIPLYLKLTEKYNKIVEFGAGTGRITIPLAINNKIIYAIDNEERMLKRLIDNAVKTNNSKVIDNIITINQDMINYKPVEKVECVIMPLTVFNYLIEDSEQEACLQNIYNDVLKSGGKLIFELLTQKTFKELDNKNDDYCFIKNIKIDNNTYYEYWRKTNIDKNIITQDRLLKKIKDNKLVEEKNIFWNNRFITKDEIEKLLTKNGFKILNIYGNCHNMEHYNNVSEDMFIEAEKM